MNEWMNEWINEWMNRLIYKKRRVAYVQFITAISCVETLLSNNTIYSINLRYWRF